MSTNNTSIKVSLEQSDCNKNCILTENTLNKTKIQGIIFFKNTDMNFIELGLYHYKKKLNRNINKSIKSLQDDGTINIINTYNLFFRYNKIVYYIKKIYIKKSEIVFDFKKRNTINTYNYEIVYKCKSKKNNILYISIPLESSNNKDINKKITINKIKKEEKNEKIGLDKDVLKIKKKSSSQGKIEDTQDYDISYDDFNTNNVFLFCNSIYYNIIHDDKDIDIQKKYLIATKDVWDPFMFLPKNNISSYKTNNNFIVYSKNDTIHINYIHPIYVPKKFYQMIGIFFDNSTKNIRNTITEFQYHKDIVEDFSNYSSIMHFYKNIKYSICSNKNTIFNIILYSIILYYLYKFVLYIL